MALQLSNFKKIITKYSLLLVFLFLLQILIGYFLIHRILYDQTKQSLQFLSDRIKNDIKFHNDKWDMDLYNDDPYTPNPNGASGFELPLYIITKQGLIIERNNPIHGLFDTSDSKQLLAFTSPQTITTDRQERWRVLSREIVRNNQREGVIFLAYYNPMPQQESEIDKKLIENIGRISSQVTINKSGMDIRKIDVRNIDYDVSFEIINKFNKVLLNNGRIPSFIDPSYIDTELQNQRLRVVADTKTHVPYLILSKPLMDPDGVTIQGILTLGKPIDFLNSTTRTFLIYSIIILLLISFPICFIFFKFLKQDLSKHSKVENTVFPITTVSFDKRESSISFDKKRIKIPFGSNQYYLCEAVFSQPKKRWDQDELLEKFGDNDSTHWRKVYDSMVALNKRLGFRLILYENRTYRMNPPLLSLLAS